MTKSVVFLPVFAPSGGASATRGKAPGAELGTNPGRRGARRNGTARVCAARAPLPSVACAAAEIAAREDQPAISRPPNPSGGDDQSEPVCAGFIVDESL